MIKLKETKFLRNKNMKSSSARWISRHIKDEYVIAAKREKYRSRSAFKLIEIHEKENIFSRKCLSVLDLGCSPGGWSQVATRILENNINNVTIVGVDLIGMEPIEGVNFIAGDFCDLTIQKSIVSFKNKFDIIMSDMAPNTIGHKSTDMIRSAALIEQVCEFADKYLSEGGTLVFKSFCQNISQNSQQFLKSNFAYFKRIKPKSSRKESIEVYFVAKNFNGRKKSSTNNLL
ncbi:RlmE family RNA methyltransferase [Candidatus Hydrogenosomobacter endosymbioticus]|uniref:Ribosomal RNA large subunit methyltransferase E n=1 Tax=Candidatus Hydrogenosomobacter endosymbioticus TaxID=2558174 RepID=A0ABM7V8A8_9PROT|nr:RlmE family RNA methyltransferase [Candidatus Hydrogenosomobacter endosymbioticus]BDB96012.1 ribosomal RNA large subunit methyltransferase E [Candidatus Hydrogenosomobacter endosymbioticus]